MTSDSVSSDGISFSSGIPSVFTSEPSAWWTREYSRAAVGEPLVRARRRHPRPAVRTRVVAVHERHHDEVAGLEAADVGTDLLDDTDGLVTDRGALVDGVLAAVGPQVRAAHARGDHLDDRLVRLGDLGRRALLETDVAGPWIVVDAHGNDLPRRR